MKKITTLLLCMMTMSGIGQHVCGTSHADQVEMVRYVEKYNQGVRNTPISRMDEKVYVPIRFHFVADNDGEGRVRPIQVIQQLERLRIDYSPLNMVPYIYSIEDATHGFNYVDDYRIYELPGSNGSTLIANKEPNAVNIYLTDNADTGNALGTILGYFSPGGDYVVSLKTETNLTSSTLSHELGHFFSLPHTFYGWESEPYDEAVHGNPVNITHHPISGQLIELMDMSNCEIAADRICDTPPDYNFGFGASNCNLNKIVRDYNGDTVRTMANNYMGYFLTCPQYFFTEGQADVMLDNYNSDSRAYLRSDFIPDTSAIDTTFTMLFPSNLQELETYTNITFDWEDVEGATHYAVHITGSGIKLDYVVSESKVFVEELKKGKFHQIDIVPFNQTRMGTVAGKVEFIAGDLVAVIDNDIISDMRITPNPVNRGNNIHVNFNSNQVLDGSCSIMDITGKLIYESRERFNSGNNSLVIDALNFESGLYILNIDTELGSIQKKIIVN